MMKNDFRSLIVDDQPLVRAILKEMLLQMDCFEEVEEAGNGREAWEMVQNRAFDIVICDIDMPRMNGIELLRLCSMNENSAAFIMVTGFMTEELRRDAFRLGAKFFIPKPFSFSVLKDSILSILQSKMDADLESSLPEPALMETEA